MVETTKYRSPKKVFSYPHNIRDRNINCNLNGCFRFVEHKTRTN